MWAAISVYLVSDGCVTPGTSRGQGLLWRRCGRRGDFSGGGLARRRSRSRCPRRAGAGAGAPGASGAGAPGAGAPGAGAPGAGAGAAGGFQGWIDSASALAAPLSTGSFAVPSHTTNQRWGGPALVAGEPITPVQIWPFGLAASLNLTS